MPVLCGILLGMQAFFIDRTSGEVAVQQIIDKQEAIEKDPRHPPIMIMPEGTQSNGKYLLPFKRGAFESLKAVVPIVLKFTSSESCKPSWECLGFLEQGSIVLSRGYYTVTVVTLPPLKPTDYLFEKYADKGSSKAEIFAWAARDIMARVAKKE